MTANNCTKNQSSDFQLTQYHHFLLLRLLSPFYLSVGLILSMGDRKCRPRPRWDFLYVLGVAILDCIGTWIRGSQKWHLEHKSQALFNMVLLVEW